MTSANMTLNYAFSSKDVDDADKKNRQGERNGGREDDLFGSNADTSLQAKFKAVRNSNKPTTDNDLKTRILSSINEFFALENWDFGGNFYFTELSTYVMNRLAPNIVNFIYMKIRYDPINHQLIFDQFYLIAQPYLRKYRL